MTDGFYSQPLRYQNLKMAAMELKKTYPFLEVFSLGQSLAGRELYAFSIGPAQNTSLFVGGVHGMEWLTSLLLTRLLEDVCRALKTGAPLADIDMNRSLETRSLTIVPCLNPDGVEIAVAGPSTAGKWETLVRGCKDTDRWQANARGVDLNHNFDAGFEILRKLEEEAGYTGPGPTRYGGPFPFSEPESAALAEFCRQFSPHQAYAFHSQGEEIYYRYGGRTPPRSRLMAQVMASASGYKIAQPEGLASHGGFKDWFIDYFGAPAFTIEIGRGKNPLPVEELEPIYARLLEMLLISILL